MSNEDNQIEIPAIDLLDSGRITEKRLAGILGKQQPYINRKKKLKFNIIVEVVGTSESTIEKNSMTKSKNKLLNRE